MVGGLTGIPYLYYTRAQVL